MPQLPIGKQIPFNFPSTGLRNFTLPGTGALLCTKRVGKISGWILDEICEAFDFPACVGGLTVGNVQDCATEHLGGGTKSCGCSASDLGNAMSPINRMFDLTTAER